MTSSKTAKSFLLAGTMALFMTLPAGHSGATPPPRILGSCSPSKVKFALSSHFTGTTSTEAVNITDTAFSFTQARQGCVIVDFTSSDDLNDPPPGTVDITAVLKNSGGTTLPGRPSVARVNLAASGPDTRTIQFVFPDVPPGVRHSHASQLTERRRHRCQFAECRGALQLNCPLTGTG